MPRILSGDEISPLIQKVIQADSGEQKQPAGYDVTVSKINSYPKTKFNLGLAKGENSSLEAVPLINDYFELNELGAYFVELNEITSIPRDAIGILLPRSTLLRNGLDVRTALFDPGYSGQPKVMLVCHRPVRIQRFARIGQLIILKSDREFSSQYSGQYQGERGANSKKT
ncbi:MAG: dCTP deaminase domain-containing protein [Nitrososphaerales archaeon]